MAQIEIISRSEEPITAVDKERAGEFVREIEVEFCKVELKLIQYSVGDEACVVWDAGLALGKFFDHIHSCGSDWTFSGKTAIDIGAGTGVVGLFAAALGANVILTDLPGVIPLLEKNIEVNKSVLKGSAIASVLSWGESVENFPSPDVILVSDCVYYDKCITKLIPTLIDLSSSKTDIFISCEDRDVGNKKEILRSFLTEMKKFFEIKMIPPGEQHPDYQCPGILLLWCKKKRLQMQDG